MHSVLRIRVSETKSATSWAAVAKLRSRGPRCNASNMLIPNVSKGRARSDMSAVASRSGPCCTGCPYDADMSANRLPYLIRITPGMAMAKKLTAAMTGIWMRKERAKEEASQLLGAVAASPLHAPLSGLSVHGSGAAGCCPHCFMTSSILHTTQINTVVWQPCMPCTG